ncbi:MAG: hypothetical protein IPL71_10285 [Anaerolineales bacterium]|uniref:hypothetical protein n=1 Tax=Candidatus Villigracilis proximus TaxID=3140683 RepID=UPI0031359CCA|nr:hypothetical protein [Anaerolineales bacterium]
MPTAILSVHNKTGLLEFAQELTALGWNLLASGGTAKLLRDNNINVTEVADYTKSPELLGGRVKTLHPAIHGGLLARPTESDHNELLNLGWDYIDLVAVNLYPFEETIAKPNVTYADAIENIDIGGVTLIRAAAKITNASLSFAIPLIMPKCYPCCKMVKFLCDQKETCSQRLQVHGEL